LGVAVFLRLAMLAFVLNDKASKRMKINTLDEIAERGRISRKTLDRELALGKGPALVRLSPRRCGVLEDDFQEWIRNRRQIPPSALEGRG
jgi:hypothetical protein